MDASTALVPSLVLSMQCTATVVAGATAAWSAPTAAVMEVPSSMSSTGLDLPDKGSVGDDDGTEQRRVAVAAIAVHQGAVGGAMALAGVARLRRSWVVPTSHDLWDNFVTTQWSDEQWRYHFRMPRALFHRLVGILRPELEKSDTVMRKAIPVEKRVAIGVFFMAHKSSYVVTSKLFGTGISTVGEIVVQFTLAMEKLLLSRTVYLGNARPVRTTTSPYPSFEAALCHSLSNVTPSLYLCFSCYSAVAQV